MNADVKNKRLIQLRPSLPLKYDKTLSDITHQAYSGNAYFDTFTSLALSLLSLFKVVNKYRKFWKFD